jgi:hypothetical protein
MNCASVVMFWTIRNTNVESARPAGHAHLRERAVEAALALRRVLDGHQHRAAPLAADADALREAQEHEQGSGRARRSWRASAGSRSGTSRRP